MVMVMVTMWVMLTRIMIEPQRPTFIKHLLVPVSVFRPSASLYQQKNGLNLLALEADPEVRLGCDCFFGGCAIKNKQGAEEPRAS